MLAFLLNVLLKALSVTGFLTVVAIILYPYGSLLVNMIQSMYFSRRYSTKVGHSNYVHFNNSPLYYREYEKNRAYSSPNQYYWPVRDCAIRSVSCFLNKSWKQTFKLFSDYCCKLNYLPDALCISDSLLDSYGYERKEIKYKWYQLGIPVHKFIQYPQYRNKTIIVQCKAGGSNSYHLVCCKQGKYYDAYDSGKFIVHAVYVPKKYI